MGPGARTAIDASSERHQRDEACRHGAFALSWTRSRELPSSTGNPAAVVPLEAWLPGGGGGDGSSETAFFVRGGGSELPLRWFTAEGRDRPGRSRHGRVGVRARLRHTELEPSRTVVKFHGTKRNARRPPRRPAVHARFPRVEMRAADASLAALVAEALGAKPDEVVRATFTRCFARRRRLRSRRASIASATGNETKTT